MVNRSRFASNPDVANDHTSGCLRCQAEAVRYRALRRQLAMMRSDLVAAPAGLERSVVRSLGLEVGVPKKIVGRETAMAAAGLVVMAGAVALFRHRAS